jgi:hypothetical protein
VTDSEVIEQEARDRDAELAQGFADCESLVSSMLATMAGREQAKAEFAKVEMADAIDDSEAFEVAAGAMIVHTNRAAALREAAFAVTTGQHRTDAYDPDQLLAAHRRFVNRSQASKAGKASREKLSETERKEAGRKAVNTRWQSNREELGKAFDGLFEENNK